MGLETISPSVSNSSQPASKMSNRGRTLDRNVCSISDLVEQSERRMSKMVREYVAAGAMDGIT